MRRARRVAALAGAAVLAVAAVGVAEVVIAPPAGDASLIELLSGIDFVPSQVALDQVLGAGAVDQLVALAAASGAAADPGVRLRAYRALALYPGPAARDALVAAVQAHASGGAGFDTVILRVAMDSLARIDGGVAVTTLAPQLDHPSRDVRAAAADALALAGSTAAVPALRSRLQIEPILQVRLALSAAIRALE